MVAENHAGSDLTPLFVQTCRKAGIKVTPQRVEIYKALVENLDHPDVETLFSVVQKKIPSVSRDTVYRTLRLFAERRPAFPVGLIQERVRFDGDLRPHHHFVCLECGKILDVEEKCFENLEPRGRITAIGKIDRVQVEMRGICCQCAAQSEATG